MQWKMSPVQTVEYNVCKGSFEPAIVHTPGQAVNPSLFLLECCMPLQAHTQSKCCAEVSTTIKQDGNFATNTWVETS